MRPINVELVRTESDRNHSQEPKRPTLKDRPVSRMESLMNQSRADLAEIHQINEDFKKERHAMNHDFKKPARPKRMDSSKFKK